VFIDCRLLLLFLSLCWWLTLLAPATMLVLLVLSSCTGFKARGCGAHYRSPTCALTSVSLAIVGFEHHWLVVDVVSCPCSEPSIDAVVYTSVVCTHKMIAAVVAVVVKMED
jgi:hypothetical protein